MSTTTSPTEAREPLLRRPFRVLREHRRVYLLLNAAAYGLGIIGFLLGLAFPELAAGRADALVEDGTADLVGWLVLQPWLFALAILGVNVVRLSLLTIVLPSMVIPFAGLALFGYWAVETGITLVPSTDQGWVALIPHALTVIIEFQAYVLLLLGALLLGRHWVFARRLGHRNRRAGYVHGLRLLGLLALPAAALLVVGAIWEAMSLRYLVHPLSELLLG